MRTIKPYFRFFKYIFVSSVLLLLMASDCDYTLTTEADPPAGGLVLREDNPESQRTPYSTKVTHQDSVLLEAVPNQGFVFSHWAHNPDNVDPVLDFRMGSDKTTRTAVFIPDPANVVPAGPPPTVIIASPVDGTHIEFGDVTTFNGSATDVEDGSITGSSLIWFSNLDGQLGSGETISGPLSSGAHTITLSATDSDGQRRTATQ